MHVSGGAVIGDRCSLGQNVYVGNKVVIGNNCKIQNNVSVYDAVTLEDDVFCGPSMVFTNVYNPRSAVVRKDEYRNTLVKKAPRSAPTAPSCAASRSASSRSSAPARVVNRNVKPYALMAGVPARHMGWMSAHGARLDAAVDRRRRSVVPDTGTRYVMKNGAVSPLEP